MRTYSVSLKTNTKQLCLQTWLHIRQFLCKNLIEAILKNLAIAKLFNGVVLRTVMHPYIHDTWISLVLTHSIGNATATFGVLNPEFTDCLVRIRQCEVTTLWVRE